MLYVIQSVLMDQTATATNGTKIYFDTKKQAEDFAVVYNTFLLLLSSIIGSSIFLCTSIGQGAIVAAIRSLLFLLLSLTGLILYILFIVVCFIVAFLYYWIKEQVQKFRKPRRNIGLLDGETAEMLTQLLQVNTSSGSSTRRSFCLITTEGIRVLEDEV